MRKSTRKREESQKVEENPVFLFYLLSSFLSSAPIMTFCVFMNLLFHANTAHEEYIIFEGFAWQRTARKRTQHDSLGGGVGGDQKRHKK